MNTSLNTEIEKTKSLHHKLYIAIAISTCALAFLLGFIVSSKTGVEPGFFEQAESGGYGVVADKPSIQNINPDIQDYYEQLNEE